MVDGNKALVYTADKFKELQATNHIAHSVYIVGIQIKTQHKKFENHCENNTRTQIGPYHINGEVQQCNTCASI
jgi:hypothetical protein